VYCDPTYGGAPPRALGGLGALSWEQFKAIQGGERTYTDGGVIIAPTTAPVAIMDPAPSSAPAIAIGPPSAPVPEAEPDQQYYQPGPYTSPFPQPDIVFEPRPSGGASGPVNVSVTAPAADVPELQEKGFGMVEAGLGAVLALLIARAWQERR